VKKRLLPFLLAGALSVAVAAPAAAQNPACDIEQVNRGGAAALAALIAVAADLNANVAVCEIDIDILNNSLNNLLRNADIDILNNSLNNLLRNADIEVTVLDDSPVTISVLGGPILIFN
jgi:hypothetical protein